MKLTCTQENFKKAIFSTERVVGKQITLPILENILLETEKGMLKVSATNLEIGVFLKIGAKIEKEGKITVPSKLISNFVNNLPPNETIEIDVKDQMLKISSDKYKAVIKGLSAQDFPIIPELESDFLFSLSAPKIKEVLPKLLACVSLDTTRLELSGINLILLENYLSFAATDSFRLAESILSLVKPPSDNYKIFIAKNSSLIIPSNTIAEVVRLISPETEEVRVAIEENQIFFQVDGARIVSRLINGKYPEYKQIIPKTFSTETFILKEDLVRSVRMASFFTASKVGEIIVKFNKTKNTVDIEAQSEEKGENKATVEATIKGEDQSIVFNPRYLLDGINSISSGSVAFLATSSSSPAVLRETSADKKIQSEFTYVIMPIKK